MQEPPQALATSTGLCCSPGAGFAGNLWLSPVPNQTVNLLIPSAVMANAGLRIKQSLMETPTGGEILFL